MDGGDDDDGTAANGGRKRTAEDMEQTASTYGAEVLPPPPPARGARGRGAASRLTAAERAKIEHEQYVERIYPRLGPDQRPRGVALDPDTCAVVGEPGALGEITFNCANHVPFLPAGGDLGTADLAFLEMLNLTSWGHRDASTAILLAKKGAGQGVDLAQMFSTPLAVYRGGQPFASAPQLVFALPDWRVVAFRGSLCVSLMQRSIDYVVKLDHAFRVLAPGHQPVQMRTDHDYSRYAELHVYMRFAEADAAAPREFVRALCADAGLVDPEMPPAIVNAEDHDYQTRGASARLRLVGAVGARAFFGRLPALVGAAEPTAWYCIVITDPARLAVDDTRFMAQTLLQSVPRYEDGPAPVALAVLAADGGLGDILRNGYRGPGPAPDAHTTDGILRELDAGQPIAAAAGQRWMGLRGDRALGRLAQVILGAGGDAAHPLAKICAALIGLRVLHIESHAEMDVDTDPRPPAERAPDADALDMLCALRTLRTVPPEAQTQLVAELASVLFFALVRVTLARSC